MDEVAISYWYDAMAIVEYSKGIFLSVGVFVRVVRLGEDTRTRMLISCAQKMTMTECDHGT